MARPASRIGLYSLRSPSRRRSRRRDWRLGHMVTIPRASEPEPLAGGTRLASRQIGGAMLTLFGCPVNRSAGLANSPNAYAIVSRNRLESFSKGRCPSRGQGVSPSFRAALVQPG
jgi:hypothetical protein